jgi:hypothetical protein
MDPMNEMHVSEPGLVVVDIPAADDATALAFQQQLAERWAQHFPSPVRRRRGARRQPPPPAV